MSDDGGARKRNAFCTECGAQLAPNVKFCTECGTPTGDAASPSGSLPPEDVAPEPQPEPETPAPDGASLTDTVRVAVPPALPAPPEPIVTRPRSVLPPPPASQSTTKAPLVNRPQLIALVAGVLVVAAIATGIIVSRSDGDEGKSAAIVNASPPTEDVPAATVPRGSASTSPRRVTTTTRAPLKSVVVRLASNLEESRSQVDEIRDVLTEFQSSGRARCTTSASESAAKLGAIIDRRQALADQIGRLADNDDPQARALAEKLKTAIDLSLDNDYLYKAWILANSSTDNLSPCARRDDENLAAANANDKEDGPIATAKIAFVDAYNAAAAPLGLRHDWTVRDF